MRRAMHLTSFVAVFASATGCSSSTSPTTVISVPPSLRLQAGDIVYHRAANGERQMLLDMGTGTTDTPGLVFECLVVVDSATGLWPCPLPVQLNTNADYWVEVSPFPPDASSGSDNRLFGGEVWIRNQKVSRTIKMSDVLFRQFWTAGQFKIIDANGTIQ
jgi:hypothetical protein